MVRGRSSSARLGYTLIELVVVVAILSILVGVAILTLTRNREKISLERAASSLRIRLEHARSLAAVAGSRLGPARLGPDRVVFNAGCPAGWPQLGITINPGAGTVQIPSAITYNAGADQLTVSCDTWNVVQETRSNGRIMAPAAAVTFAFSPSGRVIFPPGVLPSDIFVRIQHTTPGRNEGFGFRVLPSGVVCQASSPGATPASACDEDV